MKILLINQDWFAAEFREAGHEVLTASAAADADKQLTASMIHIDTVISSLPNGFTPDVILWHDNSAPLLLTGIEDCPIPCVFYSVDAHHHADLHAYLGVCFDHVFVAQREFLPRVAEGCPSASWLPLWAPRYVEPSDDKRYGAAFVGNLNARLNPKRVVFFEALEKLIPIYLGHGDYWKIFPHSEIVVNQTVKGDLNFRVFEAMMCGSLLLTERTGNGLLELFQDNVHLVTYNAGDTKEAADRIRHFLARPQEMRAIAHAGREEILARHRPVHRAQEVLAVLESVKRRPPSPVRYYSMMINHNVVATLIDETDRALAGTALIAALRAAELALETGIPPAEYESSHLIIAAIRYDQILQTGAGQQLLLKFAEAYPDNQLFALAKIRSLLNDGKRLEAEATARLVSAKPVDEVFRAAEFAITSLLDLTMD